MGQLVKNLLAMQETWVLFLGREDSLEKEMATHSSVLTWRIPWTEEPGGLHNPGGGKECLCVCGEEQWWFNGIKKCECSF